MCSLVAGQFLIFGIPGIYEYLCTSVHTRRLGTHYCALYQKLDSEASLHVTHVLMARPKYLCTYVHTRTGWGHTTARYTKN